MEWYSNYLQIYNKPFNEIPHKIIEHIKEKIHKLQSNAPLASIVVIAHNEETRIMSCLWSLCENKYEFPIELLVVNNSSTDNTENILKQIGVTYYNENQKSPGFARQCGLNHTKGQIYLCIDADTLYPPYYIQTITTALLSERISCAYSLWSFIPNNSHYNTTLFIYESLRDIYLKLQNIKRPELNVRGMTFAFKTKYAREEGFRTDIIRGEDGSLALALKKYGKIKFIRSRKARALTGYGTISADGSLFNAFRKRVIKAIKNSTSLFSSKEKYEDEDSNLIK